MHSYCVYLCVISILSTTISTTVAKSNPKCVPYHKNSATGATVVDSCPDSYSGDPQVRTKCSNANDMRDPLMASPVTDVATSKTYQNLYCAECNGAPLDSLLYWTINVICKSDQPHDVSMGYLEENIQYIKNLNKWGVLLEGRLHQCDVSFEKPDYLPARECRVESSRTSRTISDREIRDISDRKSRAISDRTRDISDSSSRAINDRTSRASGDREIRSSKPFSFALLLDVNRSDGDIVGVSQPWAGYCASGERWDPFFKKCRKLVCAIPGYKMVNGKCIKLKKN